MHAAVGSAEVVTHRAVAVIGERRWPDAPSTRAGQLQNGRALRHGVVARSAAASSLGRDRHGEVRLSVRPVPRTCPAVGCRRPGAFTRARPMHPHTSARSGRACCRKVDAVPLLRRRQVTRSFGIADDVLAYDWARPRSGSHAGVSDEPPHPRTPLTWARR